MMKKISILKIIILSLCFSVVLCLAACKQDVTSNSDENLTETSSVVFSDDGGQSTTSGIELEEDVFDNNATIEASSNDTVSSNTTDNSNQSKNQSTDKTDVNTSPENSQDNESNDAVENEDATVSDDGTVKLPVDWFD